MSIITYDGTTCTVNVPPMISSAILYPDNPVVNTYVTTTGVGHYEEIKKEMYDTVRKAENEKAVKIAGDALGEITFTAEQGTYSQENEDLKKLLNTITYKNKDKGEKTMPTGIISGEIKYSLVRETPIFNADGSIKKVVFSGPATIVIWKDGTKTVVKCMEGDDYDPEKGLMMCIMEKLLGGKSAVKKLFKKHIPGEDVTSIIESLSHAFDALESFVSNFQSVTDNKEENKE